MTGKQNEGERKPGIPGEDLRGVYTAKEFLRSRHIQLRGDTIVIGCGGVAIEAAREALRRGSDKATVVCREKADEMTATPEEIDQAKADGVHFMRGWHPKQVGGHSDGRTSGVFFKRCTRMYDDQGCFSPKYDENDVMGQYADNVIFAL